MIKILDILNEEVYGNIVKFYHRTRPTPHNKTARSFLDSIISKGFDANNEHMFGKGIYGTLNRAKVERHDVYHPVTGKVVGWDDDYYYGNIEITFTVKVSKFFIFDYKILSMLPYNVNMLQKYTGKKLTKKNYVGLQAMYFKMGDYREAQHPEESDDYASYKNDDSDILDSDDREWDTDQVEAIGFNSAYIYKNNPNIDGIIYNNMVDGGKCIAVYNIDMALPIRVEDSTTNKSVSFTNTLLKSKKFKNIFDKFNSNVKSIYAKSISDAEHTNKLSPHRKRTTIFLEKYKKLLAYNQDTKSYDVTSDIHIDNSYLTNGYLPVRFGVVDGSFSVANCKDLISLKNSPTKVNGTFDCSNCKSLKTLQYSPVEVSSFNCSGCNSLSNLIGSPTHVKNEFDCSNCKSLKTLEGITKNTLRWSLDMSGCISLKSTEHMPSAGALTLPPHLIGGM